MISLDRVGGWVDLCVGVYESISVIKLYWNKSSDALLIPIGSEGRFRSG